MKSPIKTSFDKEFFKGMSFPSFSKWWKDHSFDGDPKEYYMKWTGKKLKKSKNDTEGPRENVT